MEDYYSRYWTLGQRVKPERLQPAGSCATAVPPPPPPAATFSHAAPRADRATKMAASPGPASDRARATPARARSNGMNGL